MSTKKLLRVLGKSAGVSEYDWEKNVDMSNPDEVREYLVENMDEGWASKEERDFINEMVRVYSELLNLEDNVVEIIKKVQSNKVD